MKNAIFWVVVLCGSCKNRHFRGTSVLKELRGVTSHKMAFIILVIFYCC
jgi:hypothetical protein